MEESRIDSGKGKKKKKTQQTNKQKMHKPLSFRAELEMASFKQSAIWKMTNFTLSF